MYRKDLERCEPNHTHCPASNSGWHCGMEGQREPIVREVFYYVCFVVFFTISKHCFLKSKKKFFNGKRGSFRSL